jgi:hypothetical protein
MIDTFYPKNYGKFECNKKNGLKTFQHSGNILVFVIVALNDN